MTTITVKIKRYDPENGHAPHWQTYHAQMHNGDPVLAALMQIREEQDGSLAFRSSCRSGICGSDGMVINGWPRLACKTQIDNVVDDEGVLAIEPLFNLVCLKDLVVDQTPFWDQFSRIFPWLMPDRDDPEPSHERRMTLPPEEFELLSKASDCIFCQICYAACPIVGLDPDFLGPQALIKAYRFQADPRDHGIDARYPVLDDPEGLWRCRTTFNCTDACPKGIPITRGIQVLKRSMVKRALSR